jgi:hypothetical protein
VTKEERKIAMRVIRRSRRVLELRRQLSKAERELETAAKQLERVTGVVSVPSEAQAGVTS